MNTYSSRHLKQTQEAQSLLKNFKLETIIHPTFNVLPEDIDVWFQHEARFGQQN